ncbi:MAG: hypothetical protein GXY18_06330, partial [Methanomicrobiales archaeon]|nr:hypothetical protein [Methanomicrobiales archaeon]
MNRYQLSGFICLFILVSLAGVSISDESPQYIIYVQGGESSIIHGSEGITDIIVKDIIPYAHFSDGKEILFIPDTLVQSITGSINAVVVFSGAGGESVSLISISNLSLSHENKVLTLGVNPLEFYEGEALKSFAREKNELDAIDDDKFEITGIYFKIIGTALTNNNSLAQE